MRYLNSVGAVIIKCQFVDSIYRIKMSESNIERPLPELKETAEQITSSLLPDKSFMRYERAYKLFQEWCASKVGNNPSENVLLAYFGKICKTKKSSTLWSTYSMLQGALNILKKTFILPNSKL